MSKLWQVINEELSAAIVHARHSLVKVHNGRNGAGAGTVFQRNGLILTNAHVVRRGKIEITLPDTRRLPAQLVAYNPDLDLAAVTVEADDLEPITLGDSDTLEPGQLVFSLGHPWGVSGAVSVGPVIAVGHPPEMPGRVNRYVQAGLQLRPGHSGGPMVDALGRLVGINTMITGPKVGLAVPVDEVKNFLHQALKNSEGLKHRRV